MSLFFRVTQSQPQTLGRRYSLIGKEGQTERISPIESVGARFQHSRFPLSSVRPYLIPKKGFNQVPDTRILFIKNV